MDKAFTTFATSRFINSESVIKKLRECALRLVGEHVGVVAVHLFGSFAAGLATPRSDADIVIETDKKHPDLADMARRVFEEAPVPVELFFLTSDELGSSKGIAAAVRLKGVTLAKRSDSRLER